MSLFSFLRKSRQEPAEDGSYYSRAEDESAGARPRKRKSASGRRDEAVDPVLPEKKRARRRLVGAVALVLAAIIGLPMILDSEPKPLAEDIAIRIPSRDSAPLPPQADDAREAEQLALASLDEKEEVISAPAPSPASPSAPRPPAVAPNPAPAATPAASAASSPKTASAPAAAKPAVSTPAPAAAPATAPDAGSKVRDQGGARALALLEGRASPEPARKQEKFVIQVAALASQEKVNELQGRLKQAGIASFTQTVATSNGTATRIRVGPFSNRDEAEKVRERIVKLGLSGTLVPG